MLNFSDGKYCAVPFGGVSGTNSCTVYPNGFTPLGAFQLSVIGVVLIVLAVSKLAPSIVGFCTAETNGATAAVVNAVFCP